MAKELPPAEEFGKIAYKAFVCSEAYSTMLAKIMGKVHMPPPWGGLQQIEKQAWIDVAKAVIDSNETVST